MIGNIIAGGNHWTSGQKATGGNEIKRVGSYWYHIFTSSGTFTPTVGSLAIEIISCGGGGGGAGPAGGGGGAGELDILYSMSATNSGYTVTVGSFGAKGLYNNSAASTNGGTSKFSLGATDYVTSLGGGAGEPGGTAGSTGGSGGGTGAGAAAGGGASGSNTNVGGTGASTGTRYAGGGGGGATAVGQAASVASAPIQPGDGGAGYTLTTIDANLTSGNFTSFSGMTVICSGGAGGALTTDSTAVDRGLGGTGGGNGGVATGTTATFNASAATSYGSGGAGGGWESATPATNGDGSVGYAGVVIVRYA